MSFAHTRARISHRNFHKKDAAESKSSVFKSPIKSATNKLIRRTNAENCKDCHSIPKRERDIWMSLKSWPFLANSHGVDFPSTDMDYSQVVYAMVDQHTRCICQRFTIQSLTRSLKQTNLSVDAIILWVFKLVVSQGKLWYNALTNRDPELTVITFLCNSAFYPSLNDRGNP